LTDLSGKSTIALAPIGEARCFVERLHEDFSESHSEKLSGQDTAAVILDLALGYCIQTIDGVLLLLGKSLDAQAYALMRPLAELSVRVLWASRVNNGWQRIVADAARERLRWAKQAKRAEGLESAGSLLMSVPGIESVASRPTLPDTRSMLIQIHEADVQAGYYPHGGESEWSADLQYAIFSHFHFPAHGDMDAIVPGAHDRMRRLTRTSLIESSRRLAHAVCHHCGQNLDEVEAMLADIMKRASGDSEKET